MIIGKFISNFLILDGYKFTSEFVIDSLIDVIYDELIKIGNVASSIKEIDNSNKKCIIQALRNLNYDIYNLNDLK